MCRVSSIYFNPRSREGSDRKRDPAFAIFQKFQSTLPRGERRCRRCRRGTDFNFNPRSREGSDEDDDFDADADYESFQSTLPRGERHLGDVNTLMGGEISIHAPARGATRITAVDNGNT